MKPRFEVSGRIAKPVEEVFEAVVDPGILSEYFTTGGAKGRLTPGATVTWDFHDFPGAFPVFVTEVEQNTRIVLKWGGETPEHPANTLVTMRFEALEDGRTLVSITEEGFDPGDDGIRQSYGNCMGWSQMICAMKAWLEHGINLRAGMYR
ncbi:ATPase [Oceanicola sp. 22II-s10i]|uniref:SRPBCC family protein n=1 Tax=Oceanicola sp. 22II-s10i TaxID=1317116 RepID=UPI000B52185E|nr:SRPBCC family protein [Oceanicola sp. 22II-s10i]OWU86017.1 ATPase [Oceanicola sp. 22II-s10i]